MERSEAAFPADSIFFREIDRIVLRFEAIAHRLGVRTPVRVYIASQPRRDCCHWGPSEGEKEC
jgi:hypothetical protein